MFLLFLFGGLGPPHLPFFVIRLMKNLFLLFLFGGLCPPHPAFMFLFYFKIIYETLNCFIYFRVALPPAPPICLNFIFKILLNHYNVSFNSVGSASYIYNFMLVINWHFYFYYVLEKKRVPWYRKRIKKLMNSKIFLYVFEKGSYWAVVYQIL